MSAQKSQAGLQIKVVYPYLVDLCRCNRCTGLECCPPTVPCIHCAANTSILHTDIRKKKQQKQKLKLRQGKTQKLLFVSSKCRE